MRLVDQGSDHPSLQGGTPGCQSLQPDPGVDPPGLRQPCRVELREHTGGGRAGGDVHRPGGGRVQVQPHLPRVRHMRERVRPVEVHCLTHAVTLTGGSDSFRCPFPLSTKAIWSIVIFTRPPPNKPKPQAPQRKEVKIKLTVVVAYSR
jgi:hypothetical protein